MLKVQQVTLYHPQDVLASRLPGGPEEFAKFVRALQQVLEQHYAEAPIPASSRALVVGLGPDGRHGFWLMSPQGETPEWASLKESLLAVPRLRVENGPVALAMLCNVGEDFPKLSGPVTPPEWREVIREAGERVSVDVVLEKVLN